VIAIGSVNIFVAREGEFRMRRDNFSIGKSAVQGSHKLRSVTQSDWESFLSIAS
jgi:hypothetical protein